jgi:hypothetical protein
VKGTSRAEGASATVAAARPASLLALLAAEAGEAGAAQPILARLTNETTSRGKVYASVALTDRPWVDSVAILEQLVPHPPPLLDALLGQCADMQIFVWMTETPVAASLHVDVSSSVNVQLAGSKEWLLVPPRAVAANGELYPWLHPQRRQSQLGLATTLADHTGAVRVRTNPGDALFVPPYWGHHVVAADGAITTNLNVWCRSDAHTLVTTAITDALLPVAGWPDPTKQLALSLLLPPVVSATLDASDVARVSSALQSRYAAFRDVSPPPGRPTCRWQPVHEAQVRSRLNPHLPRAIGAATTTLAGLPRDAGLPLLLVQQWIEEVTARTLNTTDLGTLAHALSPACTGLAS